MQEEKIAVYAGSFNPFHIGHKDILDRGLEIFDKIIILVTRNSEKKYDTDLYKSCSLLISSLKHYDDEKYKDRVIVKYTTNELTVNVAKQYNAKYLLRGCRNCKDFEYEQNIAAINKSLAPDIETIILFCNPSLSHISSSMIRELWHYNEVEYSKQYLLPYYKDKFENVLV